MYIHKQKVVHCSGEFREVELTSKYLHLNQGNVIYHRLADNSSN